MLDITIRENGSVLLFSVHGDLLFQDAEEALKTIQSGIKKNKTANVIGIDCSHLKNIDSSGLGIIIKLAQEAAKIGSDFYILDISQKISALFDLSKLSDLFEIMPLSEFIKIYF